MQRPLAQTGNKPVWRNTGHVGTDVDEQRAIANDAARFIDVVKWPADEMRSRPQPANQRSRSAAIIQCAAAWREEQSRAIDAGDAASAILCEKCAQRFEAHLTKAQLRSCRMSSGISKAMDATLQRRLTGAADGLWSNTWLQ